MAYRNKKGQFMKDPASLPWSELPTTELPATPPKLPATRRVGSVVYGSSGRYSVVSEHDTRQEALWAAQCFNAEKGRATRRAVVITPRKRLHRDPDNRHYVCRVLARK